MTLEKNGTRSRRASARQCWTSGEPVAWLANKLAEFGQTLAAVALSYRELYAGRSMSRRRLNHRRFDILGQSA